jgi:AcrR family transcriptional regulator
VGRERLERDDWLAAGLDALERGGVEAVAVVPLARELGVTRGSFYWHFKSRAELLDGVLERWERLHSDEVLEALETIDDPRERLLALFERSSSKPPSIFVRLLDAADREPSVRAVLERSAARRVDVLARACREAGMPAAEARRRAVLCYAVYVGLARLMADGSLEMSARERAALTRHMRAALVP